MLKTGDSFDDALARSDCRICVFGLRMIDLSTPSGWNPVFWLSDEDTLAIGSILQGYKEADVIDKLKDVLSGKTIGAFQKAKNKHMDCWRELSRYDCDK